MWGWERQVYLLMFRVSVRHIDICYWQRWLSTLHIDLYSYTDSYTIHDGVFQKFLCPFYDTLVDTFDLLFAFSMVPESFSGWTFSAQAPSLLKVYPWWNVAP